MTNTTKALLIVLLTGYPLYGQPVALAPVLPVYDQPASRLGSEPVPLNTDPYLAPANRNPYFGDLSTHVEGAPTGNPDQPAGMANPGPAPVSAPANDPDSGASGFTGGIGHNGTDGIRGSGD